MSKPKKILLAEDSEDQARLLIFLLSKAGFEIHHAPDGIQALKALHSKKKFDLLISDIMMPGMTGFELLQQIKEEKIKIPTILLTAKQEEEDVTRGFDYGAIDYIRKPFNISEVTARVTQALKATKG